MERSRMCCEAGFHLRIGNCSLCPVNDFQYFCRLGTFRTFSVLFLFNIYCNMRIGPFFTLNRLIRAINMPVS